MKMMRFIALLCTPLLASPLIAWSDAWSGENPTVPMEQSPAAEVVRLQGIVIDKDTVFQHVTVKSVDGEKASFAFLPTTVITENGRVIPFSDLNIGDPIAVSFSETPARVARVEKL